MTTAGHSPPCSPAVMSTGISPLPRKPTYTTFIWDLTATKKFQTSDKTSLETFLTVHNIFGGDYFTKSIYPNPGRWVEGGLRFNF